MRDALATYIASSPATMNSMTAPTALGVGPNAQETVDLHTLVGMKRWGGPMLEVQYSAAATTAGAGTLLFTLDHADDTSGAAVGVDTGTPGTWQILSAAIGGAIPLSTTPVAGVAHIPLPDAKKYGRLNAFLNGTAASVTVLSAQLTTGLSQ